MYNHFSSADSVSSALSADEKSLLNLQILEAARPTVVSVGYHDADSFDGPAHGAAERRQDACFHTGSIHFLSAVRHAGNSRHTRQPALRRCESSGCLVLRQSFRYGYTHSVVPLLALGSRASFFVHNSGIFKI